MAKLKRLPRKHVKEMRVIIAKIRSGEYMHYQHEWHGSGLYDEPSCGTAHCFAGWKEMRDASKALKKSIKDMDDVVIEGACRIVPFWRVVGEFTNHKINSYADAGDYAELAWDLTDEETVVLFAGGNSLEDIESAVDKLDKGQRAVTVSGTYENGYSSTKWIDPADVDPNKLVLERNVHGHENYYYMNS